MGEPPYGGQGLDLGMAERARPTLSAQRPVGCTVCKPGRLAACPAHPSGMPPSTLLLLPGALQEVMRTMLYDVGVMWRGPTLQCPAIVFAPQHLRPPPPLPNTCIACPCALNFVGQSSSCTCACTYLPPRLSQGSPARRSAGVGDASGPGPGPGAGCAGSAGVDVDGGVFVGTACRSTRAAVRTG